MKGIAMFLGNTLTIATFILLGVVAIGPYLIEIEEVIAYSLGIIIAMVHVRLTAVIVECLTLIFNNLSTNYWEMVLAIMLKISLAVVAIISLSHLDLAGQLLVVLSYLLVILIAALVWVFDLSRGREIAF
jgi:hypothetical protein